MSLSNKSYIYFCALLEKRHQKPNLLHANMNYKINAPLRTFYVGEKLCANFSEKFSILTCRLLFVSNTYISE